MQIVREFAGGLVVTIIFVGGIWYFLKSIRFVKLVPQQQKETDNGNESPSVPNTSKE